MSLIAALETQIDKANALLEHYGSLPDADRPSRKLSVASLQVHLQDLQEQLRNAKFERDKEVLVIRVSELTSIPLQIAGSIATHAAQTLHSIAKYISTGEDGNVPERIVNSLDLQFAGVGTGSTKIYISGRLSPDLLEIVYLRIR
jgi:hypothetical protein